MKYDVFKFVGTTRNAFMTIERSKSPKHYVVHEFGTVFGTRIGTLAASENPRVTYFVFTPLRLDSQLKFAQKKQNANARQRRIRKNNIYE